MTAPASSFTLVGDQRAHTSEQAVCASAPAMMATKSPGHPMPEAHHEQIQIASKRPLSHRRRRFLLRLKTERQIAPDRAEQGRRGLVKLLCPEPFALTAEAEAVLRESEHLVTEPVNAEDAARRNRIAQLEAELVRLKGAVT